MTHKHPSPPPRHNAYLPHLPEENMHVREKRRLEDKDGKQRVENDFWVHEPHGIERHGQVLPQAGLIGVFQD